MKLILHQRYRDLLTGRVVTLLDIRGEIAIVREESAIRRVPLWGLRTFYRLEPTGAAA